MSALVFLFVGGASCGLFETRKPNDPGENRFPCAPLNTPNNVFTNVAQAYGRGDGLACYVSTLSNVQVLFDFDDADSLASPGQYQSWTRSVEEGAAQRLASGADSFFLQLQLDSTIVTEADVETRRYTYEIRFKGTSIPDTLFQGLAEITVLRDTGGQWLVGAWVDRPDPAGTTSRTWGYLRGAFRPPP